MINKILRKILITIIGVTILLLGILAIVLPGPAIIIIPIGLLILASEYYFIRQFLSPINKKLLNWVCKKKKHPKLCKKLREIQKKLDKKQN